MMEYLDRARRDFLTGCFTKEAMEEIIFKVKEESGVYKSPFSILVLDMDHFKSYNDKYGHLEGDEVLRYFSGMLHRSFVDGECIPVRFGGDEFIVVFPGKGVREALAIVNKFSHLLRKNPFLVRGRVFKLQFSGGIVSYPSDGTDSKDLLEKADKAMYYSKMRGRGRTTCYHWMWFYAFSRYLVILLLGLAVAGSIYYLLRSEKLKITGIGTTVNRVRRGIDATLGPSLDEETSTELDHVFTKSGRVFNGKIIRERENSIDFQLYLQSGVGNINISKSDINRIERAEIKK